ncbi:beta-ketoacyl synthase N-terminal-like domain-containing protein [Amycolatopsis jejuensis]|uniref:beta-ketoacyl synthase N-terminal-like domain-containing protein n=1 Tax=Amycolatopsis jejuensis TaxID=330084 RepID=UPI00068CE713|nr:beta-ketoacyl synthase N-terminal-like domain-containing protein [Amycolatopsis jejuensis]
MTDLRLQVLASGLATPHDTDDAPALTGFIESEFNPLVHRVAWQCLSGRDLDGARTAVVLASRFGDATTADVASRQLVAGRVHNALLFMQATANAILGHVSLQFSLTGPLMSLSANDSADELLSVADLLLDDGDVDHVLLINVELAAGDRVEAVCAELGSTPPSEDRAAGVLVSRGAEPLADHRRLLDLTPGVLR